ncbi:MAG: cytochrome P450 [Calothrix sp. C42_A2020_038]|nr:cytochrome P450 [Calothrix sp. C42_A2020_038]
MKLPNHIKTLPFLQKLQWVIDPLGYLENAAKQYPDIFTAEIVGFGDTVVFVNHPEGIQEIFSNDRKKFVASGEINKILIPLLGDYSLLILDGDPHKRRRQLVMPSFHKDRMRTYSEQIYNLTEKVFSELPIEQPFYARTATQEISLEVILQIVFGLSEGELFTKLKHLLASFIDTFNSPLASSMLMFPLLQRDLGAWSPWGKFVHKRKQIDELLYAEIAERREQADPNRTDILSLLILARDEEGNPMTDRELRDELITLLLAGHETTATVMAWALYWIHQNPQIYEKLLQELSTLGNSPDPMSIYKLPYLTAVCNESMRIYPVAMFSFPRIVQEPVKLMGHSLEPGTVLLASIYLTHHREDLYPEPKQFKPERFLERQFSPYEFLPFSGGVRRCIGEALAQFEMRLVLATILLNYQLVLADNQPEQPQRRGLTLGPKTGIKMLVKERHARFKPQFNMATTSA